MKLKISKPCYVGGEPKKYGDIVEVSERDGFSLECTGMAQKYVEAEKVADEPAPAPAKKKNK